MSGRLKMWLLPVALFLAIVSFILLFYSTDHRSEFEDHWKSEMDQLNEWAATFPESGSELKEFRSKGVSDFYEPQLLVYKNGELEYFLSNWLSLPEGNEVGESPTIIHREELYTAEWSARDSVGETEWRYHLIIPLKFEDDILQSQFWQSKFPTLVEIGYDVDVVNQQLSITADGPIRSALLKQMAGISIILLFMSLAFLMIRKSIRWYDELITNPFLLFVPVVIVLGFRLILEMDFVAEFTKSMPLFEKSTPVWGLGSNLGYLLIDIGLLFTFSLLVLNVPIRKWWGEVNPGIKAFSSVLSYLGLLLLWMFFGYSVGSLILNSDINIDLEEVFKLDHYSFILLFGIMVYLLSVFFICLKVAELIENFKIPLSNRILALVTASILSLPIYLYVDPGIPAFPFYLVMFLFFFLLDLFTEKKSPGYPWIAFWLLILSGFVAAMLFSYTIISDSDRRAELAANFTEVQNNYDAPDWYAAVDQQRRSGEMNYDYAVYKSGTLLWSSSAVYPVEMAEKLSASESGDMVRLDARSEMIFLLSDEEEKDAGVQLVIGKYSADFLKPFSLFSYVFFLLVLVVILMVLINERLPFLPGKWNVKIPRATSLRRKIQLIIISLTLASFVLVSVVTIYFFNVNTQRDKVELLKGHYEYLYNYFIQSPAFSELGIQSQLNRISRDRKIRIAYYKRTGDVVQKTVQTTSGEFPVYLPLEYIQENSGKHGLNRGVNRHYPQLDVLIGGVPGNAELQNYFAVGQDPIYRYKSIGFTDFLSTLLNVYLFLFLLSGVLAFLFSEGITQPLVKLRESLNKIKLGQENEPLEWDNEDEIGVLIKDYNRIIKEINESVKLLAITEREVAWREMAKQVAHEIKNPLTPMKLSIQHLQFASKRDDRDIQPLIDRTSATLIEQIDNLSRIASEFSNFAKMPEAQNEKVNLNDVVRSAHDLFRNREDMKIELILPIDDIYVFADKNYLIRVLTNLMKNSLQAIPMEREGEITIKLYRKREVALIQVKDNGTGIPDEMKDKVFKPNFTSKNSGTGLGLAICQNIVEAFHGRIFFETRLDVGTSFYVELPLMRMEGNLEPGQRVSL